MTTAKLARYVFASLLLLSAGSVAQALTLSVNCGSKQGLTTIGAALKLLQGVLASVPNTINVSGACRENVVIQSRDRLTLNAISGATVVDTSGGSADVIFIADSRNVAINNFTITGGADGIDCSDGSLCRLNGNVVQEAAGYGIWANELSQVVVIGGTLQNNSVAGLEITNGSSGQASGVTIQNNPGNGIELRAQAFLDTNATVTGNGGGVFISHAGTFNCAGCNITGNSGIGVILRRDSTGRFSGGYAITGNIGGGVLLTEESSAYFPPAGTVTGNTGGMDVFCGSSFTTAKFATLNIGGGTTNCVEPSP
jgi:hypothetical protein